MIPDSGSFTSRLGDLFILLRLTYMQIVTCYSFTDRLLYRPTIQRYFQYRKDEIISEINSYFSVNIQNHNLRARNEILRAFHIFIESATEYEARIPGLIYSAESFESVKETVMTYIANLIDISNEIIDMILRGVP